MSRWSILPQRLAAAVMTAGCAATTASAHAPQVGRSSAQSDTTSHSAAMPDSVRDYVHEAMTQFREHSVHRATVDWRALEDSVLAQASGAQTPAQTWRALTVALRGVDEHSFLMPPARAMPLSGLTARQPTAPSRPISRLIDGRVGLVTVLSHQGRNRTSYVDSLLTQIGALDSAGVCGWVVDLRDDTGGNMWPMLAGIGPLLGAEVVGSFTTSAPSEGWHYRDGRAWSGGATSPSEPMGWGSVAAPRLKHVDAPIAVLVGRRTASSGEMTLLALLGRRDVRSFGDSTGGFNSVNSSIVLRDSATMIVTSAYPRDRLGRSYGLRVAPDEPVVPDPDGSATLQHAVAWLRRQPACVESH